MDLKICKYIQGSHNENTLATTTAPHRAATIVSSISDFLMMPLTQELVAVAAQLSQTEELGDVPAPFSRAFSSGSSPPRKSRTLRHHIPKKNHRVSVKFSAKFFVNAHELGKDVQDYYDIHEKIGEGGFGQVFRVTHKKTGADRAVKIIYKSEDDEVDFEKVNTTIRNEFAVVNSLDHPNILKQYEMFEDKDKFVLVTDLYMGGELLDELEAVGCFQEEDAALLLNHMLTCINYVHDSNLAHRDLKPENILLEASMKLEDIKIIDFGLSSRTVPGVKLKEFVGTSYYMSPQIVKQEPYTNKCDVWACGVICFLVLGGYAPFDGDDLGEICDKIEEGEIIFDDEPDIWDSVTDEAKAFIRFLLSYDETDRPSAFEALQHPWLQNARRATKDTFRRASFSNAKLALSNMQGFVADSKLKEATMAMITSQMLLKDEKADIDEVFRILDLDCSGRLSKEEVKAAYKEFYETDLSDDDVDLVFKRVNISGSGMIEYSEFVMASLMSKNLIDDEKLKAAFEEFDIDGNGFIDIDELKVVLVMDDCMDDYIINKIIKQVDKDGDGKISYSEFKAMMYIKASQPTKEKQAKWQEASESGHNLLDESANLDSSISSRAFTDLKSVSGAIDVLSIFDVSSGQSTILDFSDVSHAGIRREEPPLGLSEDNSTMPLSRGGCMNLSSRLRDCTRSNRSLPKSLDSSHAFLKVNYLSSAGSGSGLEDLSDSDDESEISDRVFTP